MRIANKDKLDKLRHRLSHENDKPPAQDLFVRLFSSVK